MSTKNQAQEAQNTQVANTTPDKGIVTYQVAGQDVKLSYQIVRDFLTKGNGQVSDQDLTQFISICKYNQLNPFLNEAYLVKFGSQAAQMIVSKEAFFKRADACPNYQGIRAGVIVLREGQLLELEGNFKLKTDELLGGWAEVHRDDKKFPVIAKVSLEEYDKKQSTWNEKPLTMIAKIAKVQALREAFPAQLGAMYTQEEQSSTVDAEYSVVDSKVNREIEVKANQEVLEIAIDSEPTSKIPNASTEIAFPEEKNNNKPNF
ncbi:phage recombination protein Bet [Elizabethkingia anophelis]|nr:phage recombination protein Bet [Elizabethkingia anophelis]